jgi:hypothetical protein
MDPARRLPPHDSQASSAAGLAHGFDDLLRKAELDVRWLEKLLLPGVAPLPEGLVEQVNATVSGLRALDRVLTVLAGREPDTQLAAMASAWKERLREAEPAIERVTKALRDHLWSAQGQATLVGVLSRRRPDVGKYIASLSPEELADVRQGAEEEHQLAVAHHATHPGEPYDPSVGR